jgi:hypothetical protein
MSLGTPFNKSTAPAGIPLPKVRAKRPAPFSLRLSEAERNKLLAEAAGVPLGGYIKAKVLGSDKPGAVQSRWEQAIIAQALDCAAVLGSRSRGGTNCPPRDWLQNL